MSFITLDSTDMMKSLLELNKQLPMAERHSRLWLKIKWRKKSKHTQF